MSKSDKEKYQEALAKQRFNTNLNTGLVTKVEFLSEKQQYRATTANGDTVMFTKEDGQEIFAHAIVVYE